MKIVAVGDNCIDYYVQTKEAYPGGNPVNVAVYAKRLGVDSAYIGVVGSDVFGEVLIDALKNKQIDLSHLKIKEGKTAVTEVTVINNERVLGDYDEGVFKDFKLTNEDMSFIAQFDLMVSGIWSRVEDDVKNINIPIAFDFADKWNSPMWVKVLPHIQFAFYSDDQHTLDEVKTFIQEKWQNQLEVMVCTRGHLGSIAYDGVTFYEWGIEKCEVIDTMGAGDSYIAGFLVAYLNHRDINKAMQAGAKNSAITIAYQGTW